MNRSDGDRWDDIVSAVSAIRSHLQHGPVSQAIVMDAVATRLLEIGESVKGLDPELTETEPSIPWRDIAGMRDVLAHHYFATNPSIIQTTVDKRLTPLLHAVERLRTRLPSVP